MLLLCHQQRNGAYPLSSGVSCRDCRPSHLEQGEGGLAGGGLLDVVKCQLQQPAQLRRAGFVPAGLVELALHSGNRARMS